MVTINEGRLKNVLHNMEQEGLSQILVTSTSSVYYLTGLWVEPFERMLALYIDKDGKCVLFGNDLFGFTPGGNVQLFTHNDIDDPVRDVVKIVKGGTLGIDKEWPSRFLISLLKQRPDIKPVVGSAPVDFARMRKDQKEIDALRRSSQINDAVMEASLAVIKEGAREQELESIVEKNFAERGADRSPEGQLVCFGANCADPHHASNETVIKSGDSVIFDIFIPIKRYWCDMTRTVFFKEADEEHRKVYEIVRKANEKAESVIRPGVPMCEFDLTARKVIEDAGYGPYFNHRLGHGLGIDCHEPPDNSSVCKVIAEPGMVFSVEPGIYLKDRLGVRIEDLVLVTETGCEVLNHYTKELQIIK